MGIFAGHRLFEWWGARARSRGLGVAVLALLMVLTSVPAAAQTATVIGVNDATFESGGSGDIAVTADGSAEIVAMHLEITYDPDLLEWQGFEQGELLAGNTLVESNPETPGLVIIGFATVDPVQAEGELLVADFEVIGDGETSTVGLENVEAWDSNGFDILIETTDGTITIESGIPLWLLALIAGIIVLLLLVVLVTVVRRRGRAKGQPSAAPAPAYQTTAGSAQGTFCSNCGQALQADAAFCSNCGAQVQS